MGAVLRDLGHQEAGIRGQPSQQSADVLLADRHFVGELSETATGERRLYRVRFTVPAQQMRHVAALAARRNEFTELPQHGRPRRHVRVIGGDQAALTAGGEILADVEAEGVHRADRAHGPAPVPGTVRLRGVLDHGDPVPGGDLGDPVQIGGQTVQVDHDDRLGPAGDRGLQRRGVQIERDGVDVHEHRYGHEMERSGGAADEAQGGHDDLVARLHTRGAQRDRQRRGAVAHRHTVLRADVLRPLPLQARDLLLPRRGGGEPAGPQHPMDRLLVLIGHHRPGPDPELPGHGPATAEHRKIDRRLGRLLDCHR